MATLPRRWPTMPFWTEIATVNAADVAKAAGRGRSTTRLAVSAAMREKMIDGLRGWAQMPSRRGALLETVHHDGFDIELVGAALGVVAFVFEGRPNVLADACGVLRGGNAVVFSHRQRRLGDSAGDHAPGHRAGVARGWAASRRGRAGGQYRARGRLGALCGRALGAGGGTRLRRGGGDLGRHRSNRRHAGQSAWHRRRLDGGFRTRGRRRSARSGTPLARSQGVQYAEHLLFGRQPATLATAPRSSLTRCERLLPRTSSRSSCMSQKAASV